MTTQNFIYDKYDTDFIIGVEDEKTLINEFFKMPIIDIQILITEEKEYYNVYIINDLFMRTPINCLHLQEPKENIKNPIEYFNEKYLDFRVCEYYLWLKHGNPSENKVLSF